MILSGHFIGLVAKLFPGKTNNEELYFILILSNMLYSIFHYLVFRFILDNSKYVNNKTILDIGSGSAACSLASAIAGASQITANDIDPGTIILI